MATLFEKLTAANLPIESATETGAISGLPGVSMTDAQQAQFSAIIHEHFDPTGYAAATTAKNAIVTMAQTAVGVTLANLTTAQIKALMACLLYAAGGVDIKTMTVKPLSEWVR
jgi:hypothetical protein